MNVPQPPQEILLPVKKTITVGLPVEAAFRLFTAGFGQWWPLASHSVGEENAAACYLEGEIGGRIYEVNKDGSQVDWGQVKAWEPPHRLVFTWHPGRTPDTAQVVQVTFQEEPGGAQVELTHYGWERLGERALEVRENYVSGWDIVLGFYRESAGYHTARGKARSDSGLEQSILSPVVKTVWIDQPIDPAFQLFTERVRHWWPLATHSVGGEKAVACCLEGRAGGRFYEVWNDGSQSDWGKVLAWEPPRRVAFTLHPGRTSDFATEVEVTFKEESGGTRVTLTHRRWERLGEGAEAERKIYESGWDSVLRRYSVSAPVYPGIQPID
jgi:uncharacterized protein YndB with AHSA1/START domain